MKLPAAKPIIVGATSRLIIGGRAIWRGFSLTESAASTAQVKVWDNSGTNAGQLLANIFLTANQTIMQFPRDGGIACDQGLFCEIVSGAADWVMYVSGETRVADALAVFNDLPDDISRRKYAALVGAWESANLERMG